MRERAAKSRGHTEMQKACVMLLLVLLTLHVPLFACFIEKVKAEPNSSLVGTTTSVYATRVSSQRKSFYANGRFWVCYADGIGFVYRTSTNGSSWSDATAIKYSPGPGYKFSVWFDGTFLHYTHATGGNNVANFYRRGTPNSNGTITWSTEEQTAVSAQANIGYIQGYVSTDSDGFPWITYRQYNFTDATYHPYVVKSSLNNGTWSTAPGFPYQLSTTSGSWWAASIVPLTSGKMYVTYWYAANTIKGRLWNGTDWKSQEEVSSSSVVAGAADQISVVAAGDDVHLAFLNTTFDINYINRSYGVGWGNEVLVQSSVTSSSAPVLSINTANNMLFCFWSGSPTAHHIFYKKSVNGVWDSSPTDWIAESNNLTGNERISSFYEAYNGKIGLLYMSNSSSPYEVRFNFLQMRVRVYVTTKPNNGEGILYMVNVTAFDGSSAITSGISNLSGTVALAEVPIGDITFLAYAKSDYSQVIANATVNISSDSQSFDLICDENYGEITSNWETIITASSLSMLIVSYPSSYLALAIELGNMIKGSNIPASQRKLVNSSFREGKRRKPKR